MDLIQSSMRKQQRQQVLGHWQVLFNSSLEGTFSIYKPCLKTFSIHHTIFALSLSSVSQMQATLISHGLVALSSGCSAFLCLHPQLEMFSLA